MVTALSSYWLLYRNYSFSVTAAGGTFLDEHPESWKVSISKNKQVNFNRLGIFNVILNAI